MKSSLQYYQVCNIPKIIYPILRCEEGYIFLLFVLVKLNKISGEKGPESVFYIYKIGQE